jgi:hypothetical protein
MRKSDFDAIDQAIPSTLEDGQIIMICRIGDEILNARHG